jgi:hypothetical protein
MVDFFEKNVEVRRYHDEEGHPRVTRTTKMMDADSSFIDFHIILTTEEERADFYNKVDEIKALKLGMTVQQLRESEYIDKDGMYWDYTSKTWKEE